MPLKTGAYKYKIVSMHFIRKQLGLTVLLCSQKHWSIFTRFIRRKKRYFPSCKRVGSKAKKMANYYVHFDIANVVYYDLLLINNQSYVPFSYESFTMLSGKTLFIFYIFTLMRLLQKERWQKLLRPFQYVGRMALTNYISHTIVTLLVFGLIIKNIIPLHYGSDHYFASAFIRYKFY